MKLTKKSLLFTTMTALFSLMGLLYFLNQTSVKASNESNASYALEKVSETTNEVAFSLKVENPEQGSSIVLSLDGRDGFLNAEDIEEHLTVDEAGKLLAKKMVIVDGEEANQVIITFNETNESYVIPIVLKADSIDKAVSGTLNVLNEGITVAKENYELTFVEGMQSEDVSEQETEVSVMAAPESRIAISVTDWDGFLAALNNTTIDVINVDADITRTATNAASAPGTLSRDLTINGNGHTVNFGANNGFITLGATSNKLVVNDLTATKLGNTAIFNATSTSALWDITFTNVKTPESNIPGILFAQNSTLTLSGKNEFHATNNTITILHVISNNGAESVINTTQRADNLTTWALGINDGNRGGGTITLNNASLTAKSTQSSAIRLRYGGNSFKVENKSKLIATTGDTDGDAATVRFSTVNPNNEFIISGGSIIDIQHLGGNAPALRLNGNNFLTEVSGSSKLNIYNKGSGSPSNTANEAVNAPTTKNNFIITGKDSQVNMIADYGPAFYGQGAETLIDAGPDTEYIARGNTSSEGIGVFNLRANSHIKINNPIYYDFANTRPAGADIFDISSSTGSFVATNTDVSVWQKGKRVYIDDPVYDWTLIDFTLTGASLATISSSSDAGFSSLFGAPNNYSRMSGNNARPVVDELRIPTNADKKIYGHASVPEGVEGIRDAWTDEVDVDVVVKNADGSVAYNLTGSTVGAPGLSVYGEAARNGLFEIELPDGKFLETGQTVEVTGARRTGANSSAGKLHESLPEDLQTGVVTTIDVTPPSKAVSSTDLSNATKQITGTSDEDGAKVFVKVNGEWLKDASNNFVTTTVSGGQWTIDLQAYLSEGDKVDIYLKDDTVINENPGFTLPVTYTQEPDGVYGNISEEVDGYDSYVGYHDAINNSSTGGADDRFDSALQLTAKDVIPDNPSLEKAAASSGGATTSVGDVLTYILTGKNGKANSEDWADVVLEDTLPEGLDFDTADHGITIKTVDALGNETDVVLDVDSFEYNPTTRLLKIKVGNVPAMNGFIVSFKTTVNSSKIGQKILNTADAKGFSPQEDKNPFEPGPIDPDGPFKPINATTNGPTEIPGGEVHGILELISAPTVIDFDKHTVTMNDTRVETPVLNAPLTVSDNRGNRESWTLTATLTKEMANAGDTTKILRDAIKFNNGTTEEALDGDATLIKTHTHNAAGEFVVSSEWSSGGTGIKLEVPAGSVKKLGQYQAEITWHLGDTP